MVEKLPIPVAETIRKRRSVRTYEERPLSPEDRAKLVGYMGAVGNPFGVEVRLHIADRSVAAGGEKLGTYGIIKGAGTFLGVSVPDTEPSPLAAGYQFECLVLCAADKPGAAKGEAVIKHVDLGIGLSHFHQTALELGLPGRFAVLPQDGIALPEELHYAVSWLPA